MNYRRSIFSVIASLLLFNVAAQENFHIPSRSIQPYKLLGYKQEDFDNFGSNSKAFQKTVNEFVMQVDSFEMSPLITLGQYKQYLAAIKKDSSTAYYRSQMPDSTILSANDYNKYISEKKYEAFPVAGVSWDAAMNYCKWKTVQENKNGNLQYIYRLPQISEWLSAYNYLGKDKGDLDKNFSDWTMCGYYEGIYTGKSDSVFLFDIVNLQYIPTEKPRDKRKRVIGDSYLFQREELAGHLWRGYFSFDGFRHVGFRLIKRYLKNDNPKSLDARIVTYWDLAPVN